MGVLACDRSNCDNIMCDRVSYKYGYICDECYMELVESKLRNIADFMDSSKGGSEQYNEALKDLK